ncbi:DUF2752 domain-containing protein [Dactylosporangium sp. AC04546]|uniref:DUF2752 domain-containing protein n=1 Tax=Dactylosporangium sp. AC04546 TaxID=2862460 RepID=UPI001EE09946|nr:DUF2752 domain-containing protein [Dactylosporangium sp. AC04546]WVK85317.1 DUF2752 domain-containing protein [Dactylosporangium sp. AC04546]
MTTPLPVALPATPAGEAPVPPGSQQVPPYYYAFPPPPKSRFQRLIDRLPGWSGPAGVGALIGGGVAYTLLMRPTSAGAADTPTCIVKLLTGFDCPGCGGTRAAWYMLHGDIPAAAHHHAPLLFAAPFLAYLYVSWTVNKLNLPFKLPQLRISNGAMIGFLVAWLAFSVLRNLPWAPFTWFFV